MKLTEKERSLLRDLKAEEQLCVDKYAKYAADAEDAMLSNLFESIGQTEQHHLDTINLMMAGGVPTLKKGGRKKQAPPTGNTPASRMGIFALMHCRPRNMCLPFTIPVCLNLHSRSCATR